MAKFTIEGRTVTVHDFIGFDEEWNEIIVPVDGDAVAAYEAQGYEVVFTSEDI